MESVKKFQGSRMQWEPCDPRSAIPSISHSFVFIYGSIIFLKESAPRGRVALPGIEEMSRMMRDTAGETLLINDFFPTFERGGIFCMLSADLRRFAS
jgi:hypothetical protein